LHKKLSTAAVFLFYCFDRLLSKLLKSRSAFQRLSRHSYSVFFETICSTIGKVKYSKKILFFLMTTNVFQGRSLAVIDDLSLDERLYLFQKTQQFKQAKKNKDKEFLDSLRINDPDIGLYEVFIEDSTRTKESFGNAAEFHRIKHSKMDPSHSSFNKNESYEDGFNTLIGYDNHIFIVRTKLEGVCKWLARAGREYAERQHLEFVPVFINAGDGQHEHPTQELLDDFTFYEAARGDLSHIHLALINDPRHGRTAHSKADGLRIFKEVQIDIVAHPELGMPKYYIDKMKRNGFEVRTFDSLDEYLAQNQVAPNWYFMRAQIERMGPDIMKRAPELRKSGTLRKDQIPKIPEGVVFYHPLPMHNEFPEIPPELKNSPFNGWELESRNGYFTRIITISAFAGIIGDDFEGTPFVAKTYEDDFIHEVPIAAELKGEIHEGIKPIRNGLVIDHICRGEEPREIYTYSNRVMQIMGFDVQKHYVGLTESGKERGTFKGYISLPDHGPLSDVQVKKLGALAPGSTLNIVENGNIARKLRLSMPPRIYNFDKLACANADCISNPKHHEHVPAEFIRLDKDTFYCMYCEQPQSYKSIWQN
jgi:aspartate carbamoyltransferase